MAYTTINKSSEHFNTKLYSGNGSTQSVTGVGFQPDFTWVKNRTDGSTPNLIVDVIRGYGTSGKTLTTNETTSEQSNSSTDRFVDNGATADGFTVGNSTYTNGSSKNYASWNWKANGAGSANTDGDINSTVSANTTAGFSIVKYTGNGNDDASVGHGLGVAPKIIFFKNLSSSNNWRVQYSFVDGSRDRLQLNTTASKYDSSNVTANSNNLFYLDTGGEQNASGDNFIAYCFAEKTGYSKFGSYTGNGNNDGTFVYTGFKPAFVMIKSSSDSSTWHLADNKRIGYNPLNYRAQPNNNNAEYTGVEIYSDFLSNGFKLRNQDTDTNGARTYIYMAFAEAPLVGSNGVTAKAR